MSIEREIIFDIIIAGTTLFISVVVLLLTLLMLRFQAKPKLKIKNRGDFVLHAGEKATLKFHIENVGHLYSKPAATNITLWVNFKPEFKPIEIRYGSGAVPLKKSQDVGFGKGGSRYLKVSKIKLFSEEPGEDIEVDVKMPDKKGIYPIWIAAYSDQGDCGVHNFKVNCNKKNL